MIKNEGQVPTFYQQTVNTTFASLVVKAVLQFFNQFNDLLFLKNMDVLYAS